MSARDARRPQLERITSRAGACSAPVLQPFGAVVPSARRATDPLACQKGAMPPFSDSQTFGTTPRQVTGFLGGASRGRGRSIGWRLKAPGLEAQAGSRSYPTGDAQALPGSIGWRCSRPFVTGDAPSFRGGASKPAHAGVLAASPMSSPQEGPYREPPRGLPLRGNPGTATTAYRVGREIPPADWKAERKGPAPRGD